MPLIRSTVLVAPSSLHLLVAEVESRMVARGNSPNYKSPLLGTLKFKPHATDRDGVPLSVFNNI